MLIQQTSSPNYRSGRKGRKIIAIVDHITAGLMPGTLSWLRNPDAKASSHYLITKKGEIFQLVNDEDTAYHAGIVNNPDWPLYDHTNPNYYTLGIEHEALGGEVLTELQYQASLRIHRNLIAKWGIPVDDNHIIGHYRIDSINRRNDPGTGFPWTRLFKDLSQGTDSVPIQINDKLILGCIINDISYAPVRALAESLGRQVNWDDKSRAVVIPPVTAQIPTAAAGTINIVTGSKVIPGMMIEDHAYAPVRQLAEVLGHKVTWNDANHTVAIE